MTLFDPGFSFLRAVVGSDWHSISIGISSVLCPHLKSHPPPNTEPHSLPRPICSINDHICHSIPHPATSLVPIFVVKSEEFNGDALGGRDW